MKAWSMAARFIYHQQTGNLPNLNESSIRLHLASGTIPCAVFQKNESANMAPCIMVIGGMSVHGSADDRLVLFSRACAAAGFRVFCPSIADIEKLRITAETIASIKEAIKHITDEAELCPQGKLALFAPSFSGGMCLAAASDPDVSESISAVCTIGAFCDAHTTLVALMQRQELDEYGRLIILRNFIQHSIGINLPVLRALDIAIKDNGFQRKKPELQDYLYTKMSSRDRILFKRLRNDPQFRMRHWKNIYQTNDYLPRIMKELSLKNHVSRLRAPVILLHGLSDNVIPATESIALHHYLKANNRTSYLCVTPLINHGEAGVKLSMIFEFLSLLGAFASFFRHALTTRPAYTAGTSFHAEDPDSVGGMKKKRGA